MQVTETLNEGLKRELKVVVPAVQLEARLSQRLVDMSKQAKIRGFRPGKVPVNHLRKLYGKSVMAEVLQEAVDTSSREALSQQNLKPAYQPEIGLPEDQADVNAIIAGTRDLTYTMSFEVVPPIDLKDTSGLELERLVAEVGDHQLDEAIGRIAEQNREFTARDEGAKAKSGDRVTISFVGTVDGKVFEGGTLEDVPLVLGTGQFIPGFEEQIVGAKAGAELTVKVTFPEDYGEAGLAGKPAEFAVKVGKIEVPVDTRIDDDFAKKLGLEDVAKLRDMVKERMTAELAGMARMKLKRDVLDALDKTYQVELPAKLVEAEFNQIWQALTRELEKEKKTFADEGTSEEDARKEYTAIAERRVRLGLVLGTIGEQAGINVTEEELQQALLERVRQFPGQERQVYDFYRKNPNAMMELRGPIFEQKVVDHIVAGAKVKEKTVSREELQHAAEHDHDDDHDHDHEHEHDHDHGHEDGHDEGKAKPARKAAPKKAAPTKDAPKKKPAAKKKAAKSDDGD